MKIHYLCFIAFALLTVTTQSFASEENLEPPNILLILTDDQGYGDLSLHGNPDLETPRLDALGQESLRFNNYFVHSVCAPTRASLMTGKHFNRVSVWGVHEGREHLIRSVPTLPEILREAGYYTAMVGKWHLGINPGHRPWERGFDVALAGTNYNNRAPVYRVDSPDGPVELRGPSTEDILTREALNFIDQCPKDKPFFVYVAYNAPHHAWVGPEDLVQKYLDRGLARPTANCYAEIESMDRAIGNLLDGLDARGLADDTIVIFFSDNGPHQNPMPNADWARRNPQGFRGQKGNLYDNAHRVPLFVRIPGQTSREIDALTTIADWMPTLLDLAGVPAAQIPDGLEGRSLQPLLQGESDWPDRRIVDTHFNPTWDANTLRREPVRAELDFDRQGLWIRDQHFKLVQDRRGNRQLFDIVKDPREQNDLSAEHPEKVAELLAELRNWWSHTLEFPETFEKADLLIGHGGETRSTFKTVTFPEWRGEIGGWFRHEGFDAPGDGFTGPVTVETPGTYAVSLHSSSQGEAIGFQLTIGDAVLEDTARFGPGDLQLGEITLDTPGEQPLEFMLTDTADGTIPELYFINFERVD